ncbi:MAG: UvrD-helicase domain-containing protein [Henriciella sp.]|nr:UvrD-helicase domain-containing protein [Henriciella sp.]
MDAIEVTRQRASALHSAAIARGADPADLYGLVVNEAASRDLEVNPLAPGHSQLCGGRALIDLDADIILHENAGCAFTQAFLVAHEIGHHEFGGHVEITPTLEIDPMRQAGGSTRSEGQVVDYHRRDRREVQMDMFAKEFLLSRPFVRKLHIDERLSAEQISERFGVPLEVVFSQLYDALFLPSVPEVKKPSGPPKPLNAEQQAAADHTGSAFLLEAGPGTGKTQTLVGRILALKDGGVDPEKILVMTFSNKAAGEMLDRVSQQWPEAAGKIWIGTFHSFGYDLIKRFHEALDLPSELRLLDQAEAVALLEDEFARLDLDHFKNVWDPTEIIKDLLSAISRAHDEVASVDKLETLSQAMFVGSSDDKTRERAEKALELTQVYRRYTELKREKNVLDFGDLVSLPVKLLEGDSDVRRHVQELYSHILVDEYQDVNRASVRMLKAMKPDGRGLWVVGDPKQSIYRFRGASSVNIARFCSDFPGGETQQLIRNYRSSDEICSSFETFAQRELGDMGNRFKVTSHRGANGSTPSFIAAASKTQEIDLLVEQIVQRNSEGVEYSDQAVLCKGNARLADIAKGLEAKGIPILFLGPLFDREEVRDALSLLSLIVDPYAIGLMRAATLSSFKMTLDDVDKLVARLRAQDDIQPLDWTKLDAAACSLSSNGEPAFRKLQACFSDFTDKASPWDAVSDLLFNKTELGREYHQQLAAGNANPAIALWQLQSFMRAVQLEKGGLPIKRLLDHIRHLVVLSDERDLRELPPAAQSINAVRLLTIHGSKGLEFNTVHLPSMAGNVLPRWFPAHEAQPLPDGLIEGYDGTLIEYLKAGHDEEQACLFFVAISRAEAHLHFYSPAFTTDGKPRKRSRFLDALGDKLETCRNGDGEHSPEPPEDPIPVTFPDPPELSLAQIALFERCPRRFFYTHVLKLGGRRRETPYMLMHNAVQQVVRDVNASIDTPINMDQAMELLDAAWPELGPVGHGYELDYQLIAKQLVATLVNDREGSIALPVEPNLVLAGACTIKVVPDVIEQRPNGLRVMRRIRSGRLSKSMATSLEATALQQAGEQSGMTAEYFFLSGGDTLPVAMATRQFNNHLEKLGVAGDKIFNGLLAPKPGRGCPQCPSFFVCGSLPDGSLTKKV